MKGAIAASSQRRRGSLRSTMGTARQYQLAHHWRRGRAAINGTGRCWNGCAPAANARRLHVGEPTNPTQLGVIKTAVAAA
jgi:hypothetical protein